MFKLGSRLLVTVVLLGVALTLGGGEAAAQQRSSVDEPPPVGGSMDCPHPSR